MATSRAQSWPPGCSRCAWPSGTSTAALVLELAVVAQRQVGLLVGRVALLDRLAALHLGIELRAEQDDDVRDPQPGEEDDHAAEASVGLVVGAEVRDVEREQRRGGDP